MGIFIKRLQKRYPRGLPEGWDVVRIDDVAERGTGHTPDRKIPEYWNDGVKWISLADSHRLDRVFISTTTHTISEAGIRHSSAVKHPPGTVVLSRDAGVGMSAIMLDEMAVSQHFIAWRCSDRLHNLFLYYWLQFMKPELERQAVGSTIKTIGFTYFDRLQMILPPRPQQETIAGSLFNLDKLWLTIDELIRRQTKRRGWIMQQLLTGCRRLPVFANQETQHDVILRDVPADWDVVPIGDVTRCMTRRNGTGETHVLTASGKYGLVDQRQFFNRSVAGENLSQYYLLKRGEFAYNRSRMKGYAYGAIKRLDRYPQGAISTLYLCFAIADARVNSDFLRWYCEGGQMNRQLSRVTPVGGRAHGLLNLTSDDFFSIRILLPPLPEQRAIAGVLDTAQKEIDLLKELRAQIHIQKRGLMQKLLTGQIRVPEVSHG